ncbi:MAG TPA: hypothetical protein DCL60_08960 [Armatimonadetes bacterium]|mgnify:CR=1 FL=1|nr:hypothetical protein [Armatimonadota bacterium]
MFNWLSNPNTMSVVGIWLAAFGTLAIYSILYKENPVYRMAEHIFIGAAAGYGVYVTWSQILKPLWWDKITSGQWYWVFALVAGSMFYFIYSQRHLWISRLIFGALLGLISGTVFKGFAGVNMDRIYASFKPVAGHGMTAAQSLNNILFIFVLLTVMAYFFFSFEHKDAIRRVPSSIGRWVLMFAFGAMFGSTVMARMSLLIGRIYFLLHDWLHVAH